jgi:hypothetical protein
VNPPWKRPHQVPEVLIVQHPWPAAPSQQKYGSMFQSRRSRFFLDSRPMRN